MRLKTESLQLSAITFKYVFFLRWSCIDSSAPASVCHSVPREQSELWEELWARSLKSVMSDNLPALQYNAEFKWEARVSILAFNSVPQSAQTCKMLPGSTILPPWDALPTHGRLDPKLPAVLLPQPHLPPNNCWVKWRVKAPVKSRFIM